MAHLNTTALEIETIRENKVASRNPKNQLKVKTKIASIVDELAHYARNHFSCEEAIFAEHMKRISGLFSKF